MTDPARNVHANPFQYVIKNDLNDIKMEIENESLLTPEEKEASYDIIIEHKKKMEDFDKFLTHQYMKFNHKINKCLYRECYQDILKPREEVKTCHIECSEGVKAAEKFVQQRIDMLNKEVGNCLTNAQKNNKNIMQESFECYDKLLRAFALVKKDVLTEFNYYE